ncbi:dcp2, box A domain-containing protein [Ditylenchus destructor]|uniref:mRNA-decapping enzyme 2 n=1 Tax=Ditylenchus destructor TaxID=166010 RepID=A0AAD4N448_9BILA|nr:dcp2, box A domain-containing protein [Ditylenchus destructor]
MSAQRPQSKGKVSKNRSSVAARMDKHTLQQQRGRTNTARENVTTNHPFFFGGANEMDQVLTNALASVIAGAPIPTDNAGNNQLKPGGTARSSGRGQRTQTNNANHKVNQNVSSIGKSSSSPTKSLRSITPGYFGPTIPEHIMEDLLFRFLYNIPENEKMSEIRVCFQVEQAHWFYVDFYCSSGNTDYPDCKKIGFREFVRQVFYKCDYLQKWKDNVDNIIESFRLYKSNVPTYGLVLLDSSLNYVLLVQGYFATKNTWGFPKGKVNEDEVPIQCAIREVLEEVGYDATDKIVSRKRPLQCFLNDTLIRLYIATDVPMDFNFGPHLRKEIRKISWFSVWDLPANKFDDQGCARLGMSPNRFYTVIPFVQDIRKFIQKEQAKRHKPKVTILRKDSSAFQPVIPKAQSHQSQLNVCNTSMETDQAENIPPHSSSFFDQTIPPIYDSKGESSSDNEGDKLFKPLNFDSNQPASFTGQTFLESFMKMSSQTPTPNTNNLTENLAEKSVKAQPGVIGSESKSRRSKDIKQPKPLHSSLVINVYEAPPEAPPNETASPTNRNARAKSFNPLLDPVQPSTSGIQLSNMSAIGAVGEVVNESQRSKLRQSKGSNGSQTNNNQSQSQSNVRAAVIQSHNQGISVDISQLFGKIENEAINPDILTQNVVGHMSFNLPSENAAGQEYADASTSAVTTSTPIYRRGPPPQPAESMIFDFTVNQHQQRQQIPGANTSFSAYQLNSSQNHHNPAHSLNTSMASTESAGWVSPATAMAMDIARNEAEDEQFCVHLCKAWKSFKLDRSRIILPF